MISVNKIINELMTSNCYIIHSSNNNSCIIIDPGSEKSINEIRYINENGLNPEYIILTHEHTDHNWGVNALRKSYNNVKLICTEECNQNIALTNKSYFLYYYNIKDYEYKISSAEIIIEKKIDFITWNSINIYFFKTPGHSIGSMCINIEDCLFTGDTIMQYKTYIPKNNGSKEDYNQSINFLLKRFDNKSEIKVYPGHGEAFYLDEFIFEKK